MITNFLYINTNRYNLASIKILNIINHLKKFNKENCEFLST